MKTIKKMRNNLKTFAEGIIYRYFKRPFRRIASILAYTIQGCKTYDWDYDYLIQDIEFKIRRMQGYFQKGEIIDPGSTEIMLKQMQEVLDLFKKIREDEYFTGYHLLSGNEQDEFLEKKQQEANDDWIKVWKLLAEYMHNWWD